MRIHQPPLPSAIRAALLHSNPPPPLSIQCVRALQHTASQTTTNNIGRQQKKKKIFSTHRNLATSSIPVETDSIAGPSCSLCLECLSSTILATYNFRKKFKIDLPPWLLRFSATAREEPEFFTEELVVLGGRPCWPPDDSCCCWSDPTAAAATAAAANPAAK